MITAIFAFLAKNTLGLAARYPGPSFTLVAVVFAFLLGCWFWGDHVETEWQASASRQRGIIQASADRQSAKYEARIGVLLKKITNKEAEVRDEISKNYGSCIANDTTARLWGESFAWTAWRDAAR
jgi:hypothetical protein